MYDAMMPRCGGVAMASAMAFLISGCDAAGPGSNPALVESDGSSDSKLTYREGGVVLSKTASDELADFVAATQFDAVLPMSIRLDAMNENVRERLFKRIASTSREIDKAVQRIRAAGDEPRKRDVNRLEAANSRMNTIFKYLLKDGERARSHERAKKLVRRFPFLRGLPADKVSELLAQSVQRSAKQRDESDLTSPTPAAVDTSSGDQCRMDCSITAAVAFGTVEIAYGSGLWACSLATVAYLPCFALATGAQWYGIGSLVWDLYTCTKKCN